MDNTTIIGIDLAKTIFYLHAVDARGKLLFRKKLNRTQLLECLTQLPTKVIIAMEACGSAHYWARVALRAGHAVKLIHAKYVKAFRAKSKNDSKDAQAIAEAASRPGTRSIPVKSVEQQSLQLLHRFREDAIRQRNAQACRIRSVLLEFG